MGMINASTGKSAEVLLAAIISCMHKSAKRGCREREAMHIQELSKSISKHSSVFLHMKQGQALLSCISI